MQHRSKYRKLSCYIEAITKPQRHIEAMSTTKQQRSMSATTSKSNNTTTKSEPRNKPSHSKRTQAIALGQSRRKVSSIKLEWSGTAETSRMWEDSAVAKKTNLRSRWVCGCTRSSIETITAPTKPTKGQRKRIEYLEEPLPPPSLFNEPPGKVAPTGVRALWAKIVIRHVRLNAYTQIVPDNWWFWKHWGTNLGELQCAAFNTE